MAGADVYSVQARVGHVQQRIGLKSCGGQSEEPRVTLITAGYGGGGLKVAAVVVRGGTGQSNRLTHPPDPGLIPSTLYGPASTTRNKS